MRNEDLRVLAFGFGGLGFIGLGGLGFIGFGGLGFIGFRGLGVYRVSGFKGALAGNLGFCVQLAHCLRSIWLSGQVIIRRREYLYPLIRAPL